MNIIKRLKGEKPPEMAKVKVTRNTRARMPDGEVVSVSAGQELNLVKSDADALVGAGAAERIFSDAEKAEHKRIADLIPAPHDPRPLPENWGALPESFAKWWELAERLRCLKGRQLEIEACVLRGYGLSDEEKHWMRHDIAAQGGEQGQRWKLIDGWLKAHPINIRTPSERDFQDQRRLRDALQRQGEAIDDFLEENRAELVGLQMECGVHVLKANGRLRKVAAELAETGFEIFKARIAALGDVGERLVQQWFEKSADKQRFTIQVNKPAGLRYGFTDHDTGERVCYIDLTVEALSSLLPRYEAEEKRLEKLLKNARAELAKAQPDKPKLALPS